MAISVGSGCCGKPVPGNYPDYVEALSYAYNDTSGASIQAGQAPEPGTLPMALLALGAAGVLALRRKRAATASA